MMNMVDLKYEESFCGLCGVPVGVISASNSDTASCICYDCMKKITEIETT
jgi:hypothetical protein